MKAKMMQNWKISLQPFCCGSGVSFFDVLTFPFAGKSFFLPF